MVFAVSRRLVLRPQQWKRRVHELQRWNVQPCCSSKQRIMVFAVSHRLVLRPQQWKRRVHELQRWNVQSFDDGTK